MNILSELQELDNLIIEHTRPPVTPILRNKLAFATEQAEAHSEAVEKQEKTLATQIETIERLVKENQALIFEKEKIEAQIVQKESNFRSIIDQINARENKPRFGRDKNGLWNPLGV